MSDFYGVTDLQKAIAGRIREVVRLRIGPNSRDILDAGGSVALTPGECEEAAATAIATSLSEGYAIVTKEEAAKAKTFDTLLDTLKQRLQDASEETLKNYGSTERAVGMRNGLHIAAIALDNIRAEHLNTEDKEQG